MKSMLYATVGDYVQFIQHPRGSETHKGETGNWKTIEGETVVKGIECDGADSFAAKRRAMVELWPACTVRFMSDKM